ncbi:MAG: hypothetical protein WDN76_11405 [Alphaproteobacteria bacterium]
MSNRKRSRAAAAADAAPGQLIQPPFNANMALLGVQMLHANLAAARTVFDVWRDAIRIQQDALLDAFDTQLHETAPVNYTEEAPMPAKADSAVRAAPHDAHGKGRRGALDAFA